MPEAHETLQDALKLFAESQDRVKSLEDAVAILSPANKILDAVVCHLDVAQGANWPIQIKTSPDFMRPFFEAELIKQRAASASMQARLIAARDAMQSK